MFCQEAFLFPVERMVLLSADLASGRRISHSILPGVIIAPKLEALHPHFTIEGGEGE